MTDPKLPTTSMAPRPKGCPFVHNETNAAPMNCGDWCKLWITSENEPGTCTFVWLAKNSNRIALSLEQLAKAS